MILEKGYCKYCGANINTDVRFCKKCGKDLKEESNLISRINSKINLLAVLIGLIIVVFIFLAGASYLSIIIINKVMDIFLYMFLLLFGMLFFGGITTGVISSKNFEDGLINGVVLSILFFLIMGIILGVVLFITLGIASVIASAFSSLGTTAPSTTTTSSSLETIFLILKGILAIITCFLAGVGGGALGAWIRGVIK